MTTPAIYIEPWAAGIMAFCKAVVLREAVTVLNTAWARQDAPYPKPHAIVLDMSSCERITAADVLLDDGDGTETNYLFRFENQRIEVDCTGTRHEKIARALMNAHQYPDLFTHLQGAGWRVGWKGPLGRAENLTGLVGTHKEGRTHLTLGFGLVLRQLGTTVASDTAYPDIFNVDSDTLHINPDPQIPLTPPGGGGGS